MRTFIGIDLGKQLRDRLIALREKMASVCTEVNWVEPENMHVTLLFLGEVDGRDIPDVCRVVAEQTAEQDAFSLELASVGCFPNLRRPRVIWAGIRDGSENLRAIHASLEDPLGELGCYRREARPFTPHVTLGRVRADRLPDELEAVLAAQQNWRGGTTVVNQVQVMSSELTSRGPLYTVLSRARLG